MKKKTLLLIIALCFCFLPVVKAETNVEGKDLTDGVYKLTEDLTDGLTFDGVTAVLDLNGHDITATNDAILVKGDANLTIKGTGTVSTNGTNHAAITNLGATVVVESGTFNSENWYTIKNMGTMTINGGTFTQGKDNAGNASLIANGWYDGTKATAKDKNFNPPVAGTKKAGAVLTINGGTFNHFTKTSTIKTDDWGKTTITGGKFSSADGYLLQATGECVVSGGTFKGYNDIFVFNADGTEGYEPGIANVSGGTFDAENIANGNNSKGTLTITGGTFNIVGFTYDDDKVTTTITGGSFSAEGVEDYISELSKVTEEDDFYVVSDNTEIEATIEEGKVGFESEEALDNTYELTVTVTAKEVAEKATEALTNEFAESKEFKDLKVISIYDIEVQDADGETVEMKDGKFVISIPVKEEMQKYDVYKVAYIKDGKIAELFDAKLVDGKIVFNTTHLSTYAVVGMNSVVETNPVTEENPKTVDNFCLYLGICLISVSGLGLCLYTLKKRFN